MKPTTFRSVLHCGWILLLAVPMACSHHQAPVAQSAHAVAGQQSPPKQAPRPSSADVGASAHLSNAGSAVFFEFDSALLEADARDALSKTASQILKRNASLVSIEGNCDELGTVEYNLALGQQRAESAKQYLVHMGVAPQRVRTLSNGSQRPRYPGHDEASYAKNRRDDIVYQ